MATALVTVTVLAPPVPPPPPAPSPCQQAANDCAPCSQCGQTPAPVMPRCNVVLQDGVYTNATVTVDNGCITIVEAGDAPLYDPDPCCATPGGGGSGGPGPQGPPGPAGAPATVQVGTVSTTAPGTPATVTNVGTAQNAIFDYTIPRGAPGADGTSPTGLTISAADIVFADGALQSVPVQWPPLMLVTLNPIDVAGATWVQVKDSGNGNVTMTLSLAGYDSALRAWANGELVAAADALQLQIDALTARMTAAELRLDTIEATCCGP